MLHLINLKNKSHELVIDYINLIKDENVINWWDDKVQFFIKNESLALNPRIHLSFQLELERCSKETQEKAMLIFQKIELIQYEYNVYKNLINHPKKQ